MTSRGRSAGGWLAIVAAGLIGAFLIAADRHRLSDEPRLVALPVLPPESYSLTWYENFFSTTKWMAALTRSLQIAALVVSISVVLGTLAALGVSTDAAALAQHGSRRSSSCR